MKDIKANRSISLPEQHLIRATGYLDGVLIKRLDQIRIGEKCERVEVHWRSPDSLTGDVRAPGVLMKQCCH
jgi:hypothetical protein